MSRPPVLAIPALEPGRGGGHLTRCLALVGELRSLGREARLLLPPEAGDSSGIFAAGFDDAWRITEAEALAKTWDWIILDRFQTPPEAYARWSALAPLIGIDEGGPCRDSFDFLIDVLPGLPGRSKPNIAGVFLPPLFRERGGAPPQHPPKLLISFGQEDAAGLGPAAAKALAAKNSGGLMEITLLTGGLNRNNRPAPEGVRQLAGIPNLAGRLAGYDLLITHYGLTAFEAVRAGTPALLAAPSAYHKKLSRAAGFPFAGTGTRGAAAVARLLVRGNALNAAFFQRLAKSRAALAARWNLETEPQQSLAGLITGFTPLVSRHCPVCGAAVSGPVYGRAADRAFRRCPVCGVMYMNRLNPPPVEYGREYFFELYQKQYGKTYIEDFPNLIAMGKRRLAIIKTLLAGGGSAPALLDIGCAYGPFLAAAKAEGFSPFGLDPAEDAIRYVTQTLNIPAARGFFPDCPLPEGVSAGLVDAVTLWYVIEHFRDCVPVFAALRRILKPGGVLAFASPSRTGVSGRFRPERFLSQSPADHWTIWSPGICKKALSLAGFTVKKIVISGHHPERFPLLGRFARTPKSPLYGLLLAASNLFALGDTFEVYATAPGRADTINKETICKNG